MISRMFQGGSRGFGGSPRSFGGWVGGGDDVDDDAAESAGGASGSLPLSLSLSLEGDNGGGGGGGGGGGTNRGTVGFNGIVHGLPPAPAAAATVLSEAEMDAIATVAQLGYGRKLARECVEHLRQRGHPSYADVNVILDHIESMAGGAAEEEKKGGAATDTASLSLTDAGLGTSDEFGGEGATAAAVAVVSAEGLRGDGGRDFPRRDQWQDRCWELEKLVASYQTEIKNLRSRVKELEDEKLCKICLERPIEVMLTPCGHRATCQICHDDYVKQGNRTCVICRAHISTALRVYDG